MLANLHGYGEKSETSIMTPEQQAREKIDTQLVASGWAVQNYTKIDFSSGRGIALREVPLKSGTCDYLLLVDRKPVGVVEAKKEGTLLANFHFSTNPQVSKPFSATNGIPTRVRDRYSAFIAPKRWLDGSPNPTPSAPVWRECQWIIRSSPPAPKAQWQVRLRT